MWLRQREQVAYSYLTKPKMWRTKRSQEFRAYMAASPVPACVHLPVRVFRVCVLSHVQLCSYIVCARSLVSAQLFYQAVTECQPLCAVVRQQREDCCPPALLTVMSTVWWSCHSSLRVRDMNGTTITELTNTAWQLESDTTCWVLVCNNNKTETFWIEVSSCHNTKWQNLFPVSRYLELKVPIISSIYSIRDLAVGALPRLGWT